MTFFSFAAFIASTFFKRWASMKGPFLRLRDILYLLRAPRPRRRRIINLSKPSQARTTFGLPHGETGDVHGRLAFATTEGVVDRVHGDTTRLGAHTLQRLRPALPIEVSSCSELPTVPSVARQSIGTRRISVEGSRSVA